MQLYYMKRDGNKLSSASVVLMTVAIIYKFVLVLTGVGILLFWRQPLKEYLQGYDWLYFLGLFLNMIVVIALLLIMFSPGVIRVIFNKTEKILIRFRVWKKSEVRSGKINQFLTGYRETVSFLQKNDLRDCHWYFFAEAKRVFSYLCGIPGIGVIWNVHVRYYSVAGFRLYSGRYAAGARRTGNYGSIVQSCFCKGFSRIFSYDFYVYNKRSQFLSDYDGQLYSVGNANDKTEERKEWKLKRAF